MDDMQRVQLAHTGKKLLAELTRQVRSRAQLRDTLLRKVPEANGGTQEILVDVPA